MTVVIATKSNPSDEAHLQPWRCAFLPSKVHDVGRSPVVLGRPTRLVGSILAEFHHRGIPASHAGAAPDRLPSPGGQDPQPTSPHLTTSRTATEAIIVVIDRSLVQFLFGERRGSRVSLRFLLRGARVRSCEYQLCDTTTATAIAINARRLLIVCDAGRTSAAERTRAIRWIRSVAHRIGYECSINGLHSLGTSYTVVLADTEVDNAARSVVEWYRGGKVR